MRLLLMCVFVTATLPVAFGATTRSYIEFGNPGATVRTRAMASDGAGFVYLTGNADWRFFQTTGVFFTQNPNTLGGIFVRKVEVSTGRVVYSLRIGSSAVSTGIAVDPQGNVYVVGTTTAADIPNGNQPPRVPSRQDSDVFLLKVNSSGTAVVYSRTFGGTQLDYAASIALSADGSIALTGTTTSPEFPVTPNAAQFGFVASSNNPNAFVLRLATSDGALQYGTFLGGIGGAWGASVAYDHAGDIYVSGSAGFYFPIVGGVYTNLPVTLSATGFVAKLSKQTGQLAYSTYIPGGDDLVIAVDADKQLYIAGTAMHLFIPTPGSIAGEADNADAFLMKLSADGRTVRFATVFGSGGRDSPSAILIKDDSVVVAGLEEGNWFPATDWSQPNCDLDAYLGSTYGAAFASTFSLDGRLLSSFTRSNCDTPSVVGIGFNGPHLVMVGTRSTSEVSFVIEFDLQSKSPVQIEAVTDAAAYQTGPFAPLTIVTIWGKGLGPESGVQAVPSNGFFPRRWQAHRFSTAERPCRCSTSRKTGSTPFFLDPHSGGPHFTSR